MSTRRKVIIWGIVIFLVVQAPTAMAHAGSKAAGALVHAGHQLSIFVTTLFSAIGG